MANLTGTNSGDTLIGTDGDDTIDGRDGNDVIDGRGGADLMRGGRGDDIFYVDDVGDTVEELSGQGVDEVRSTISYALGSHVENLVLLGTESIDGTGNSLNNRITGNDAANVIRGGGGTDTFVGGGGDDIYFVEAEVTVSKRGGYSFSGIDQVVEAAGGGIDTIYSNASLTLPAEVENIVLVGSLDLSAFGNALDNVIIGNSGRNFIQAHAGDDYIDGGAGADHMDGGAGNDTYVVDDINDFVVESFDGGTDRVESYISYQLANSELEHLTLLGSAAIDGTGNFRDNHIVGNDAANQLKGDAGNDILIAGGGDDSVDGGLGNDWIEGGEGNDGLSAGDGADILFGGGGADTIDGGAGDDTYFVDAQDVVVERAGGGLDNVAATQSYALTAGAEVEVLSTASHGGTAAIDLTGNDFGQTIIGNAGNNRLTGGGGADRLQGLDGDDTMIVDADDMIIEAIGGGFDHVAAMTGYFLSAGAEVELLSTADSAGTAGIYLVGNEFGQAIVGNAGNNYFVGGGGADILRGLAGDDTMIVDADDVVVEEVGGGFDNVAASVNYVLASDAEVEVLSTTDSAGTAAIDLAGNVFAQSVIGNAGSNRLDGGAGSDLLQGLGGADMFAFTTALAPDNVDRIGDFVGGLDTIALDDAIFTGLAPGALAAEAFAIGTQAQDADDRIIYDPASGILLFDPDGTGGAVAEHFATLQPGTVLAASDFLVI